MEQRLIKLREQMVIDGLDAVFLSNPISRLYLTGFTGSAGWVLITRDAQFLISDFRYVGQAMEEAPSFTFIKHEGQPFRDVKDILGKTNVKEIAFEQDHLTFQQYDKLASVLEGFVLLPKSGLIEKLREVKDDEEVALIREAAAIADRAFLSILEEVRPGLTESAIDLRLEILMREQGATSSSFETIVASGPRSALPHGRASDRVLQKGDLVTLDFGALYKGYCSDMTRTFMIGTPSSLQKEIYQIVLVAEQKAVAAIRPGIPGKEVDEVARNWITKHGYGERFGHSTGHGVGLEVHEGPNLSFRGETKLAPGMVVTVEPGIYLPDVGGVRIEDDVLVTEEGYEVLTPSSKELIIID
ncbi:Xaa-Pro aminopeptidase [Marininema mesophilum]|uniref:Xaa-Pro aminopeptidase n=1 Tax=Marininema mesophilum TaxID=1048340 RepID=A0A1H2U9K2_9BACL|nr:Xaa-Pro peptidase family protein [Marininema mesophilum]SDW52883.1 Xaa-Pro aminopeptidase [Marininema mesophilum]